MAFLKYSDLPIFADFTNENNEPIRTAAQVFAATEASIALEPMLMPNRYLGKTQIRNDYSTTGPLEGKFSFTFYPLIEKDTSLLNIDSQNQINFFKLTGNFTQGHQIYFSNFLLKKCYLQGYSVKINPYQPVSVSANFISYDVRDLKSTSIAPYTDSNLTIAKSNSTPYYEVLHALTTKMEGSSINIPTAKVAIDVNVDCQRNPIYTLGSQIPDSVILTAAERTTSIQGEDIGAVVDITGANAGATNIYFLPLSKNGTSPTSVNNVLNFDINGRIVSQQLQVGQNSMMNGRVVIKEIIL
jgi:hypothetical protein